MDEIVGFLIKELGFKELIKIWCKGYIAMIFIASQLY